MKKLFIALSLVALAGCETAAQFQQASSAGIKNAFTCEQITAAFSAYDRDRKSVEAFMAMAQMVNLDTSKVTTESVDSYYETAKNSVNIALLIKGCTPM